MRLSDLQNKDVVDVATGKRIGNVIDAEIEEETGSIIRLIIYDKKGFFSLKASDEVGIKWSQIKKIGTDFSYKKYVIVWYTYYRKGVR